MKKYIFFLLIILILSILLKQEQIVSVISYDDYEYSMYILEFPNKNLSTNNLEDYFNDIQIVYVTPYVNELYKSKIKYNQYFFEPISLKENINRFITSYLNHLNNFGYQKDALDYRINGIKIDRIKVYSKESDIKKINIENIKYRKIE